MKEFVNINQNSKQNQSCAIQQAKRIQHQHPSIRIYTHTHTPYHSILPASTHWARVYKFLRSLYSKQSKFINIRMRMWKTKEVKKKVKKRKYFFNQNNFLNGKKSLNRRIQLEKICKNASRGNLSSGNAWKTRGSGEYHYTHLGFHHLLFTCYAWVSSIPNRKKKENTRRKQTPNTMTLCHICVVWCTSTPRALV